MHILLTALYFYKANFPLEAFMEFGNYALEIIVFIRSVMLYI